jgi:hypothetical protein
MKTTAAAFCAAILATSAQAQSSSYLSGQELYRRLTGAEGQNMMALGYIAGVQDSRAGVTICIPPATVTLGQMADMVKQTLERVPSERHLSADIFVEATLSNRWPCARKGSSL